VSAGAIPGLKQAIEAEEKRQAAGKTSKSLEQQLLTKYPAIQWPN
jgi:hypothetical protein